MFTVFKRFIWCAALMVVAGQTFAASFDCAKARRPLEKLICAHPELDAADTRMGDVYKQVNAGFPLKGFVSTTQRFFVAGYAQCMLDSKGQISNGADAVCAAQESVGPHHQRGARHQPCDLRCEFKTTRDN